MLKGDTDFTLLQIAAYPGCEKAFAKAVEQQIGKLPKDARASHEGVLKTGPRQYWLFNRACEVPADCGAATELSASRIRFVLDGPEAWRTLMRSVAIDLDPSFFRTGQFAQTGIHHTPVLIWRTGDTRYEVFALRTFAAGIAEWLSH